MSKSVDVRAVMDAAAANARLGVELQITADAIDCVRASVTELIEADTAFNVAFNEWINDKTSQTALDALGHATDVRAAALARIQGESP